MARATRQDGIHLDERAREHHIIDGDFHLNLEADDLVPYLENEKARRTVREFGLPKAGSTLVAYQSKVAKDSTEHDPTDAFGSPTDAEEISLVMEEVGTDEVVVQPKVDLPFPNGPYPAVREELAEAYNDYVVEEVIDVDEGIYASIAIPEWNPERSAREIDRLADDAGFVAVQGWIPGYRPFGHRDNDPIFEAMTRHDLPLLLHTGPTPTDVDSLALDAKESFTERIMTGILHSAVDSVFNLVETAVFDSYPDLDVVICETGVTWIPFVAHHMEEYYNINTGDIPLTARKFETDDDALDRMPSEYVFDNMFVTTQPISLPNRTDETAGILKACRAEETFIFSTDWPHGTLDVPNWVFQNPAITDDLRTDILRENAERAFRLPR